MSKDMKPPAHLTGPQKFFFEWAGWNYNPATETREQGRTHGAIRLAAAEWWACEAGWSFEWSIDPDCDSRDFAPKKKRWSLWQCLCRDLEGKPRASLGGIDFGPDKEPWGDTYRRVVEAELALEGMNDTPGREMPAGISVKGGESDVGPTA